MGNILSSLKEREESGNKFTHNSPAKIYNKKSQLERASTKKNSDLHTKSSNWLHQRFSAR